MGEAANRGRVCFLVSSRISEGTRGALQQLFREEGESLQVPLPAPGARWKGRFVQGFDVVVEMEDELTREDAADLLSALASFSCGLLFFVTDADAPCALSRESFPFIATSVAAGAAGVELTTSCPPAGGLGEAGIVSGTLRAGEKGAPGRDDILALCAGAPARAVECRMAVGGLLRSRHATGERRFVPDRGGAALRALDALVRAAREWAGTFAAVPA